MIEIVVGISVNTWTLMWESRRQAPKCHERNYILSPQNDILEDKTQNVGAFCSLIGNMDNPLIFIH